MKKCYFLLILCTLVIAIALMLTACSKRATGPAGPQGSAGQQGTPGPQGAPGPASSQIFEGDSVPAAALGNVGDFYINEQTDSLYGPKTLSGWGNAISLQGTAGTQGAPGVPGTPGTPGTSGTPGALYQVPTVFSYVLNGNIKANLTDEFKPGVLNFYLSEADGGTQDPGTLYTSINTAIPEHVLTESYLYRIILIPGGVPGTNVDPHTLTYKEVSTKFGIQP